VNIPYTPPPPPGEPEKPLFADVLAFRQEHGLDLDLDPIEDEFEIDDRVFDSINDWVKGDPVAVASWERWGVPLRSPSDRHIALLRGLGSISLDVAEREHPRCG